MKKYLLPILLISCAPATDGEKSVIACKEKLKDQAKLEDKLKECKSDVEYYEHLRELEATTSD